MGINFFFFIKKKDLENIFTSLLYNNIYIYREREREGEYFLMIFYFYNCYMHIESLYFQKYINFKKSLYALKIAIITKGNSYSSI